MKLATLILVAITLVGIVCLTIGAAMLHPAAGWLTAGTCLTAIGLLTNLDRE